MDNKSLLAVHRRFFVEKDQLFFEKIGESFVPAPMIAEDWGRGDLQRSLEVGYEM